MKAKVYNYAISHQYLQLIIRIINFFRITNCLVIIKCMLHYGENRKPLLTIIIFSRALSSKKKKSLLQYSRQKINLLKDSIFRITYPTLRGFHTSMEKSSLK